LQNDLSSNALDRVRSRDLSSRARGLLGSVLDGWLDIYIHEAGLGRLWWHIRSVRGCILLESNSRPENVIVNMDLYISERVWKKMEALRGVVKDVIFGS